MSAEYNRQLQHMFIDGQVSAVDCAGWQCKVKSDNLETDWMPMPTMRAGKAHIWSPLEVGEQVTFACLNGDPNHARILASFYTDQKAPKEASESLFMINFENDDFLKHDKDGNFTLETAKTFKVKAKDIELIAENSIKTQSQTQTHTAQTITMETPLLTVTGSISQGGGMSRSAATFASFAGPIKTNSTITATGTIHSNTDVTSDVSLNNHVHSGVLAGGTDTEKPK